MAQSIILYRMVLPEHTCPFGLRAKQLLDGQGLQFEDIILSSREEVDAFKDKHGVSTTPVTFVDDEMIGGSQELEHWLKNRESAAPAQ